MRHLKFIGAALAVVLGVGTIVAAIYGAGAWARGLQTVEQASDDHKELTPITVHNSDTVLTRQRVTQLEEADKVYIGEQTKVREKLDKTNAMALEAVIILREMRKR
jgi:hypothetical protein